MAEVRKTTGLGRKKPKTLSGIETQAADQAHLNADNAGKNLKPYQGLKRNLPTFALTSICRKKPKTLSGIETD